jgi:hypothetical protein
VEFAPVENWETATCPRGQVAKRVLEGFTGRKLPDLSAWITSTNRAAGLRNGGRRNLRHPGRSLPAPHPQYGVPFGAAVFAGDYIALSAVRLYQPLWQPDWLCRLARLFSCAVPALPAGFRLHARRKPL